MPSFWPIGGAAISEAGGAVLPPDLSDALNASDSPSARFGIALAAALVTAAGNSCGVAVRVGDGLDVADQASNDILANLAERLRLGDGTATAAVLAANANASMGFTATVLAAWQLLLAEDLQTTGAAVANVRKFAALVDALAATGQAQGQMTALAACTTALALEGLLVQGWSAELADQALLADNATAIARLLAPVLDSTMAVVAGAHGALRMSCVSADALVLEAGPTALLRAGETLVDGVLLYATLRLGGVDYMGWALNTDLQAATEYRNTPFDSFATYRGRHYAAGRAGIVRFTGATRTDTDAGQPVDSWLRTTLTNFGTNQWKRVPEAFIGVTADGDLVLKVVSREPGTGAKQEDWYRMVRQQMDGPGQNNVQIGRGLKSTWWQFELHNVDGAGFDLHNLTLRPLMLDRRT